MKEDFDLIHTHFPTPWSAEISLICAKLKKKPCILTYHNDVEKKGLLGVLTRIYNNTILKLVLRYVDKILVTQPRYINDSRILGKYREKVVIITNGISELPAEDHRLREKATLLFVGLLDKYHRYKGLGYLIEALSLLKMYWLDIRLEVIGKGELVEEYRDLAHRLELDDNICFHGYVDNQRLSEFYRSSTLFVLPSIDLHEGFGIVLLEAMAHGLPVITTEVIGLADEIRDRNAGYIVPPRDPTSIAEAVDLFLSDPRRARETGESWRAGER
jgi:glycosyltransferase involved in cell wall biosynthesis